jgi:hypothetical protein
MYVLYVSILTPQSSYHLLTLVPNTHLLVYVMISTLPRGHQIWQDRKRHKSQILNKEIPTPQHIPHSLDGILS